MRRHRETEEAESSIKAGNYLNLLKLQSRHTQFLRKRLENSPSNALLLGHNYQNSMLQVLAESLLTTLQVNVLLKKQQAVKQNEIRLVKLCETRWSRRHTSISAVKKTISAILATLEDISDESGGCAIKSRAGSGGCISCPSAAEESIFCLKRIRYAWKRRIKSGEKRLVVQIFNYFVGEESKGKGKKGSQGNSPLQKTITITGLSRRTVHLILSEYDCLSTDDFVSPAKRYKCSRIKRVIDSFDSLVIRLKIYEMFDSRVQVIVRTTNKPVATIRDGIRLLFNICYSYFASIDMSRSPSPDQDKREEDIILPPGGAPAIPPAGAPAIPPGGALAIPWLQQSLLEVHP
uniref:Uncharacterized protein n=1 Tax=Amphimedon queenslandica TaxID=400682 RepID=A0A1X7VFD6_AMPQE